MQDSTVTSQQDVAQDSSAANEELNSGTKFTNESNNDIIHITPTKNIDSKETIPNNLSSSSSQKNVDESSPSNPENIPDPTPDEKTCRICLSNEIEEAGDRFVCPCKCKGTMKFVHLTCLNQWREKSVKNSSYYQCDQCKWKYSFRRTDFAKVLINEGKKTTN